MGYYAHKFPRQREEYAAHDNQKELGINFSQTCERAIRQAVQVEKDRQWAIKYADFVQAYNDMVERDGLPLAQYRTF